MPAAAAVVAFMKKFLARVAVSLAQTEDGRKIVYIIVGCFVAIILGLIMVVPAIFLNIVPAAEESHIDNVYSVAIHNIEQDTRTLRNDEVIGNDGIEINVNKLLAIDTFLLEQDFDQATISSVESLSQHFIRTETTTVVEEVIAECVVDEEDEEENKEEVEEEEVCTIEEEVQYTYFYERTYNQTLNRLVTANIITEDLREAIMLVYEILETE